MYQPYCNRKHTTLLHLQTVLFSATLPKLLVEFASAGLSDPTLVRLDVDAKIPETLKMGFFHCRPEVKDALLIHVLTSVIPQGQQVRHLSHAAYPRGPASLKAGQGAVDGLLFISIAWVIRVTGNWHNLS